MINKKMKESKKTRKIHFFHRHGIFQKGSAKGYHEDCLANGQLNKIANIVLNIGIVSAVISLLYGISNVCGIPTYFYSGMEVLQELKGSFLIIYSIAGMITSLVIWGMLIGVNGILRTLMEVTQKTNEKGKQGQAPRPDRNKIEKLLTIIARIVLIFGILLAIVLFLYGLYDFSYVMENDYNGMEIVKNTEGFFFIIYSLLATFFSLFTWWLLKVIYKISFILRIINKGLEP